MRRAARALPALLLMGVLFLLSSQSTLALAGDPGRNDTLHDFGHLAGYAVLGFSIAYAFGQFLRPWLMPVLAFCAVAAFAISDEVHQAFVPGRDASAFDAAIDVAGAVIGISVYLIVSRRKPH